MAVVLDVAEDPVGPVDATVDHVVWAVPDLAAAAADLTAACGDLPCGGGVHPAWGTRNLVFAAGDSYVELIAVEDPSVAHRTAFGRRITEVAARGGGLTMWAVRLPQLEAVAARLGLEPAAGSRATDDGQLLTWSTAGTEEAAVSGLPFFIRWADGLPPHALGGGPLPATRLMSVTTSDEPEQLVAWLGGSLPGVRHTPGDGGIESIVLTTAAGRLHLPRERG